MVGYFNRGEILEALDEEIEKFEARTSDPNVKGAEWQGAYVALITLQGFRERLLQKEKERTGG